MARWSSTTAASTSPFGRQHQTEQAVRFVGIRLQLDGAPKRRDGGLVLAGPVLHVAERVVHRRRLGIDPERLHHRSGRARGDLGSFVEILISNPLRVAERGVRFGKFRIGRRGARQQSDRAIHVAGNVVPIEQRARFRIRVERLRARRRQPADARPVGGRQRARKRASAIERAAERVDERLLDREDVAFDGLLPVGRVRRRALPPRNDQRTRSRPATEMLRTCVAPSSRRSAASGCRPAGSPARAPTRAAGR